MRFASENIPPTEFSVIEYAPYPSQPYLPLPSHRKRVAVTASSAGALINFCHGLILDMVNRGHRVFAFAPELSNSDLRILSHIGAEAYSLPTQLALWDKYRRMRELSNLFGDLAPDVLLVESARNGMVTVAAAKIAKIPHVVTVVPSFGPAFMEGAAGASAWSHRQAMKTVFRTVFSWSDAVVFHSAHDMKFADDTKLLPPSKSAVAVGGWGEDLHRHVQRSLPPLDRGVLFLMAAPLDQLQGILEYCEAAKTMRLKARRARFFLASTPGEAIAPVGTAILKQYREFVQYIGPIDDAGSLISKCHVLVAPSWGNGAPRSLFQALALGRPVITTDTRSCRDFVQQGLNGYKVPVRDPEALVRAMIQILQRPDLMPLMAEDSRRLALRFYDMNAVNALVLETLSL
ncbi:glycosyl transferase group 1 [Rhodomicrobium vannielii ATCC 17100]|uniref:Glycosyl transferase group 1 n=1 Tax=Rhodomicrobium vannielii (strain ATCC 17100 / DSM 162 / LMG 4299 / NCIMB 10020 / ATH 3.1.1) TaxID=648757 RepID=E3I2W3_RHOVT|nr:glycosyltransferase [Rhodomicrobium vannielii]ADP72558.1 glycosyl transferase group 1 [Rhodomicrobium vannielii ATCC 17100]